MAINQNPTSRRWLKHFVGFSVTAICLIVFVRQIDLIEVLKALSGFYWGYLFVGVASLSFGYTMRIFRWSIMLQTTGVRTSFAKCSAPFLGSIALNNVLPLRLGDVLRAFVFPRSMGITKTTATSSLVMERLIDLMSLLACLAIGLFAIQTIAIPTEIKSSAVTLAAIGGITLTLVFFYSGKLSIFFIGLAERKSPQDRLGLFFKTLYELLKGFNSMSRPKALIGTLIISLLVWVGEAGLFYFVLLGTGLDGSPAIALFVMSLATLSTLVPSSPGYVGPFHLAAFTAISLVGGTAVQAGSYAVIVHFTLWLTTTIAGVTAIWLEPELYRIAKIQAPKIDNQVNY